MTGYTPDLSNSAIKSLLAAVLSAQVMGHDDCSGSSDKGGSQCPCQGVSGFCDFYAHEVKAHGIEYRFGTAKKQRNRHSGQGIGTVFPKYIQGKAGGGRGGKQLHKKDGQHLGGQNGFWDQLSHGLPQGFQKSGRTQEAGGGHESAKRRRDLSRCPKSFFRAADKVLKHRSSCPQPRQHHGQCHKRDHELGDPDHHNKTSPHIIFIIYGEVLDSILRIKTKSASWGSGFVSEFYAKRLIAACSMASPSL